MKRFKKLLRGRSENERGAALVLTALSLVLLLWAGATGVDVGFTVYGSRQAQAMADTAALDLARYISYADTLASISDVQTYLNTKLAEVDTDNGSNAVMTVFPGYYSNGTFTKNGYQGLGCRPTVAPPVHPGCNAVEVTANQSVPQIFFGGFNMLQQHSGSTASGSVARSSIAADTPESNFSIGSFLASFNSQQSAVLNKILGNKLGSSVSLTAVGYQGLANADVTLNQLITASGGLLSASNIMTAQLTAAQWLSIYTNAVGNGYGTGGTAYTALQALNFTNSSTTEVALCNMANFTMNGTLFSCTGNTSIPEQGLNTSVNVLQLMTTEAELANGTSGIDVTSALNLSDGLLSIGNVNLSLQVIQPAQYGYGPVGTTVPTAQVTSTLSMNLSTLGVQLGTLSIPLTAASGTATLAGVTCVDNAMTQTQINGSTNALSTSVSLTLAGVASTVGSLSISGVSNASAPFSGSVVPPTSTTQSAGTNPVTIGTTSPTLNFTANGGINALVAGLLTSTSVLATAYGPVLQAVGVQVAGAQIADYYTNCGAVSLVQ